MAKKMIRPIRTETEYDEALEEIERYFENQPKPGTLEADRFDLLALIVEDYERKSWPIEPPETNRGDPLSDGNGGLYPSRSWASARLAAACFRHSCQEASPHDENGLEAAPRVEDSGRSADRAASDPGKKVSGVSA